MFPRFLHCFLSNGFEKWSGSLIWSKRQCLTVLLTKVLSCGTWLSSLHGLLPFAARSYSNCSKFPCPRGCKFLFSSWPLCDSFCSGWVFTGMSLQKGFGFFFFFPSVETSLQRDFTFVPTMSGMFLVWNWFAFPVFSLWWVEFQTVKWCKFGCVHSICLIELTLCV